MSCKGTHGEHSPKLCAWALWRAGWLAVLLTAGFGAGPVQAAEAEPAESSGHAALLPSTSAPTLTLHGFGTLGVVRSSDEGAAFVRDLSQPDGPGRDWSARVDSLLGLQAGLRISPQSEGVLQVVSRYHHDGSYRPELTWAFLRHDFTTDFSLRAGRLGTELYMLGDSRLVGYSNISLRPPPEFYGSLVFTYIDGVDFSATLPVSTGLLQGKLYAGRSPEKVPFLDEVSWDLGGTTLTGGNLDYLNGPWQLRLGHARVRFNHDIPMDEWLRANGDPFGGVPYNTLAPGMSMAGALARFTTLGLVYDEGPLNIQFMLNQIRHDSPAYEDSRAGYLQVAYRLGTITPYLSLSRSLSSADPVPPSGIPAVDSLSGSMAAMSHTDQHTLTLGGAGTSSATWP